MIFGNGFEPARIGEYAFTQSPSSSIRNSTFRSITRRSGVFDVQVYGGGGGGGGRVIGNNNRPGEAGKNSLASYGKVFVMSTVSSFQSTLGDGGIGGVASLNTPGDPGGPSSFFGVSSSGAEGGRAGASAVGLNPVPEGAPSAFVGKGGYGGGASGPWINDDGQAGQPGSIVITRLA